MTGCCCTSSEDRANFSQTLSEIERYRFTSKEMDEETGLYYMSARYQNPKTSRWVSSDPSGWQLVNPMEQDEQGKFQIRSGFSIVESMNPYSYCSNNPIRYNDPSGMREEEGAGPVYIEPAQFAQQEWTEKKGFKEDFWKTACATTSILNEISEEFTAQTGEVMTKEMAISAIKAAIEKGDIREGDAYINNWAGAANAMWKDLGMEGSWSYSEGGTIQKHTIFHVFFFSSNKEGIGWLQPGEHFVNSMGPGQLWDPWGGIPRLGPMHLGFAGRYEGENGLQPGSLRRIANIRGIRNLWLNQ